MISCIKNAGREDSIPSEKELDRTSSPNPTAPGTLTGPIRARRMPIEPLRRGILCNKGNRLRCTEGDVEQSSRSRCQCTCEIFVLTCVKNYLEIHFNIRSILQVHKSSIYSL